jgi:hypothetical protein
LSGKKNLRRPLKQFLEKVEKFYGWKAPGIIIGAFMMDWGLELSATGWSSMHSWKPDLPPEISRIILPSGKGLRY